MTSDKVRVGHRELILDVDRDLQRGSDVVDPTTGAAPEDADELLHAFLQTGRHLVAVLTTILRLRCMHRLGRIAILDPFLGNVGRLSKSLVLMLSYAVTL